LKSTSKTSPTGSVVSRFPPFLDWDLTVGTRADAVEWGFDTGGRNPVTVSVFGIRVCACECLAARFTDDDSADFNAQDTESDVYFYVDGGRRR
jgi:hypothetical protein